MKVLVASRNSKKLAELQRLLDGAQITGIELLSLKDVPEYPEAPETGATFEANARIKAMDGLQHTGLPTVADDSGIAVDALNGMPGVLSARWCGEHGRDAENNRLLLAQLADTPDERRGAAFVSSCVLALPEALAQELDLGTSEEAGAATVAVTGTWRGQILRAEKGSNGFGYDPLFEPEQTPGRSSAELSAAEKDELSHRGQALEQLLPTLRALAALTT